MYPVANEYGVQGTHLLFSLFALTHSHSIYYPPLQNNLLPRSRANLYCNVDRFWGPSFLFDGYHGSSGLSGGGKATGRKINHSAPSSAEIENEWSYTFSPSVVLHGVDSENFTFLYLCKATL